MADAPIEGRSYTVAQLFSGHVFGLDYYQREYTWSRKDVQQLLDDLHRRFAASWRPTHARQSTATYDPYFLGPVVYFQDESVTYLVDGQQRITTLHLLLIHVYRLLCEQAGVDDDVADLTALIRRSKHGDRTFTVNIDERSDLLTALLDDKPYDLPPDPTPSVRNLYERARDLEEDFPAGLRDEALLHFLDWLRDRVCLVGIRALSRDHGWEIFETMNDRGNKLNSVDLLKSYLLSHIGYGHAALNKKWRKTLTYLSGFGAHTSSDFIKTLLVAKYANGDPDRQDIERAAHEWVRQNSHRISLRTADDYRRLVEADFCTLAERYGTLLAATEKPGSGLEAVFYNRVNKLDEQMVLILAAVTPADTNVDFKEKARLVANFLDLLYIRRFINGRVGQPGDLTDDLATLLPRIRACRDLSALRTMLSSEVATLEDDFVGGKTFGLRPDNRRQVRYLLARITTFVDVNSGCPDQMYDFVTEPYEVEHIWANRFERYQHGVKTEDKFRSYRNRLGALVLLPKSDNASYQADTYTDKVARYFRHNLLAASLNAGAYSKWPNFSRFRKNWGLENMFRPYKDFTSRAIDERQELYLRLCEIVWDPQRLGFEVPRNIRPEQRVARRTRARYDVTIADLLEVGVLRPGETIVGVNKRKSYRANIERDGRIRVASGEVFNSPSRAAIFVMDRKSYNGWTFWQVHRGHDDVTLNRIRERALEDGLVEQLRNRDTILATNDS